MQIQLDDLKVRYFNEVVMSQIQGVDLDKVIDNLFRTYLEQVGSQTGKSYAAWLEEQFKGTPEQKRAKAPAKESSKGSSGR